MIGLLVTLTIAAMNIRAKTNIKVMPKLKLRGYTKYALVKKPIIAISRKLFLIGPGFHMDDFTLTVLFLLTLCLLTTTYLFYTSKEERVFKVLGMENKDG